MKNEMLGACACTTHLNVVENVRAFLLRSLAVSLLLTRLLHAKHLLWRKCLQWVLKAYAISVHRTSALQRMVLCRHVACAQSILCCTLSVLSLVCRPAEGSRQHCAREVWTFPGQFQGREGSQHRIVFSQLQAMRDAPLSWQATLSYLMDGPLANALISGQVPRQLQRKAIACSHATQRCSCMSVIER